MPTSTNSHRSIDRRTFLGVSGSCAAHMLFMASSAPQSARRFPAGVTRGPLVSQEPWGRLEEVAEGVWALEDSPLRHAPHTAEELIGDWDRPYSRELGAFPLPSLRISKYFPPVSRIDGAYGDRNLVCSCEPLEAYAAAH